MSEREDGKEVLREVRFGPGSKPPPGMYVENPDAPGQLVTPAYLELLRGTLREAVADRTEGAKLDPDVKVLADELAVLHLPEHTVADRKVAEPTRVEIYQSTRMAAYLHRRGWRFHPEHEEIRYVPTPNAGDLKTHGVHIERNPDGTWPIVDPEAFYDADQIVVAQTPGGEWVASHPCGVHAQHRVKARAHADVVQQLIRKIDESRTDE